MTWQCLMPILSVKKPPYETSNGNEKEHLKKKLTQKDGQKLQF